MAEGIESPATETDMISSPEPNSASPDHMLQSGDESQNTSPLMRHKTPGPVHQVQEPVISADNTHEIVEAKLEKLRDEAEALEEKKREMKRKENGEEEEEEGARKKKAPYKLILCTNQCRYRVVKKACRRLDFKLNEDENIDWDIYWADTGLQP